MRSLGQRPVSLVARPPGAFVGAGGGRRLKHRLKELAGEFASRSLSRREKKRVGPAILFASENVREKVDQVQTVRKRRRFDGTDWGNANAAAEDLLELPILRINGRSRG
jgi:hypothetical protein